MTQLTTRAGARISSLCFGTMQFGGKADETASRRMYDMCRDGGITAFDTANGYTGGASETLLGAMAKADGEQVFVATKVGYIGGSGRDNIQSQFLVSERRLGLDTIDLLYLHRWDNNTPLEETFETLANLQTQGRIRYIGVSNFSAWQTVKAQAVAHSLGTRIDVIQPMYNLVKRVAEIEILPMAQAEGIAVMPYSPLGGGLLTGKYAQDTSNGRLAEDTRYAARYGLDWMHQAAQDLSALATRMGTAPETLAVAWVASNPSITAPIISASGPDQLAVSLAAAAYDLNDTDRDAITSITTTPPPATDRLEEA